jgi:hypothetical protein
MTISEQLMKFNNQLKKPWKASFQNPNGSWQPIGNGDYETLDAAMYAALEKCFTEKLVCAAFEASSDTVMGKNLFYVRPQDLIDGYNRPNWGGYS